MAELFGSEVKAVKKDLKFKSKKGNDVAVKFEGEDYSTAKLMGSVKEIVDLAEADTDKAEKDAKVEKPEVKETPETKEGE